VWYPGTQDFGSCQETRNFGTALLSIQSSALSGFWVAQRFSAAISPLLDGLQPSGFLNFFVRRNVLPMCPSLCRNVGLSPTLTL